MIISLLRNNDPAELRRILALGQVDESITKPPANKPYRTIMFEAIGYLFSVTLNHDGPIHSYAVSLKHGREAALTALFRAEGLQATDPLQVIIEPNKTNRN